VFTGFNDHNVHKLNDPKRQPDAHFDRINLGKSKYTHQPIYLSQHERLMSIHREGSESKDRFRSMTHLNESHRKIKNNHVVGQIL
jgi:hypothetical protein